MESTNTGVIYYIWNETNNKFYIGQCISFRFNGERHGVENRFKCHIKRALNDHSDCPKFYNAIRKYGTNVWKYKILKICPLNELNNEEKQSIKEYDAIKFGYNLVEGNGGYSRDKSNQDYWDNPKNREKQSKRMIEFWKDTDKGKEMTKNMKKGWKLSKKKETQSDKLSKVSKRKIIHGIRLEKNIVWKRDVSFFEELKK